MSIIRNLICLENNKASVIRLKDDKLEFIKKDGEIEFSITINFWDWWKRVVSYVDEDEVDICFIYDKKYDLLDYKDIMDYNIINKKESSWKKEYIKSYFWELKPTYFNLIVLDPKKQEYVLSGEKKISSKTFYTNLNFKQSNLIDNLNEKREDLIEEEVEIAEEDYSVFAKYFFDLIKSERNK